MGFKFNTFTLIELLAVIVVLAIIMVIATTQVTATISKSRGQSFSSSYKMIVKEIKNRMVIAGLEDTTASIECDDAEGSTNTCSTKYDISAEDYTMSVKANSGTNKFGYILTLTGKGKFNNMEFGNKEVKCPLSGACGNIANGTFTSTTDDGTTKAATIKVYICGDGSVLATDSCTN